MGYRIVPLGEWGNIPYVVYLMVINGKIIKGGKVKGPIQTRSYSAGTEENWTMRGTPSPTNYVFSQIFRMCVANNIPVQFYCHDCGSVPITWTDAYGNEQITNASAYEEIESSLNQHLRDTLGRHPIGDGGLLDLNNNRWIYMDKISDPGNMGSLIRSAAWFGLKNIALSPGCVDPYNPKVLRSGMGGHFNISIHNNISLSQFCDTHSIIAGEKTGQDSTKFKFPKKCVLVLGNEAHGHTKQNQQYINTYITLKKLGSGESLNVSNAGAILFHLLTINQL